MTEQFDPYAILDVPKDADTAHIRRAYRQRSKSAHPDHGGDRTQWDRLAVAHAVLSDKARRARFDETGRFDEERPEADRQQAHALIAEQITALADLFVRVNFDVSRDPRRQPVLELVEKHIRKEMREAEKVLQTGRTHLDFMRDYAKRITRRKKANGLDQIDAIMRQKIGQIEQQIVQIEEALRVRKIALDVLADYSFKHDPPATHANTFATFALTEDRG